MEAANTIDALHEQIRVINVDLVKKQRRCDIFVSALVISCVALLLSPISLFLVDMPYALLIVACILLVMATIRDRIRAEIMEHEDLKLDGLLILDQAEKMQMWLSWTTSNN